MDIHHVYINIYIYIYMFMYLYIYIYIHICIYIYWRAPVDIHRQGSAEAKQFCWNCQLSCLLFSRLGGLVSCLVLLSAFGRSRPWRGLQTPWTGVLGPWTGVQRPWTGVQKPWTAVQRPQAAPAGQAGRCTGSSQHEVRI